MRAVEPVTIALMACVVPCTRISPRAKVRPQRLAGFVRGDRERIDDPGNGIGRNRRRLVQAQATVRLGNNEIRERSAGVDRETKTAPTQTQFPPNLPELAGAQGCIALAQERHDEFPAETAAPHTIRPGVRRPLLGHQVQRLAPTRRPKRHPGQEEQ